MTAPLRPTHHHDHRQPTSPAGEFVAAGTAGEAPRRGPHPNRTGEVPR